MKRREYVGIVIFDESEYNSHAHEHILSRINHHETTNGLEQFGFI